MKHIIKTIWTVVFLVMMNNALALEIHVTDNHDALWFSTSTNTLLNRSSTELATQHISRGIRLAHQAMQKELVLSDELIANHNLCVGYLSSGETEIAKPFCAQAKEIAQQAFNLIKVRGAYFLSKNTENINAKMAYPLLQVMLDNIDYHTSHIRASLAIK